MDAPETGSLVFLPPRPPRCSPALDLPDRHTASRGSIPPSRWAPLNATASTPLGRSVSRPNPSGARPAVELISPPSISFGLAGSFAPSSECDGASYHSALTACDRGRPAPAAPGSPRLPIPPHLVDGL